MRFLLILTIGLFFQMTSFAQVDSKEMQEELEKMTEELQKQLKNFNFEEFQFDTMMLKNFQLPEGFNPENFMMPNDIDMNEMMKMMEKQFSQMDMEGMMKMMEENFGKMDFSEMEKMMEPLMKGDIFIVPSPEELEKKEEKNIAPNKKKKKQKKTYKM